MNEMAKDLKDDQIEALADYFSSKPALTHRVRDKGFAAVGEYLFKKGNRYSGIPACKSCHGEFGQGTDELPRLAGQHKRYVADQLQAFGERARTNDNAIMHTIASKLTDKRVFGLVKDFGTSQSPKSTRPLTTYWCPSRPGHPALRNNFASSLLLRTWLPMTGRRVRRPTLFSLWRKARRENSAASRLLGSTSLRFALHGWQRMEIEALALYVSGIKEETKEEQ